MAQTTPHSTQGKGAWVEKASNNKSTTAYGDTQHTCISIILQLETYSQGNFWK